MLTHQYIVRETGEVVSEELIADRSVHLIYSRVREHAPTLFKALTSRQVSSLLGFLHYDLLTRPGKTSGLAMLNKIGADWRDCLLPVERLDTPRKVFERQIRYWDCRPMDPSPTAIVSPADSKVLLGSFARTPELFIKEKFFSARELLGPKERWFSCFAGGDFAVFRLTPDKYHYNHLPVTGRVVDIYELDGHYHSCNPRAIVSLASLHAKNRRVVTIIDTNVEGGSLVGLVAMIEVVALMIGDIRQCYSSIRYDQPRTVTKGMTVIKGAAKSVYRPGSSTDILIFQKNAMAFSDDLLVNLRRTDVSSRFSSGLCQPLVETDIKVRSTIGHRRPGGPGVRERSN
ncbi:phosphatidylserine decarboxylase [Desulfogranum mediterraneum]|uniref:phosphatidylserine decarboxylase n=1 Tax=Desulfogranum mediterraneum TaxID=160661 RepID=UPI0004202801|nr:phosphatidylserine decarboxylase [Desulfogranum mediterraneum]